MPNYRRNFVPGGTFFFTLVTQNRAPLFQCESARTILGTAFRECQRDWPFEIHALVLLPDHLHSIWSLPPGDARYPARWSRIKAEFTRNWLAGGGGEQTIRQAGACPTSLHILYHRDYSTESITTTFGDAMERRWPPYRERISKMRQIWLADIQRLKQERARRDQEKR